MRPGRTPLPSTALPEALRAGEDTGRRARLARRAPARGQRPRLRLLRRALPIRFLEHVARTPPWSERPMVLARVVLNPRAPRGLSLRLVSPLYWRDLAEVATSPTVPAAVRVRAEASLRDLLPDLRLGERITLAKIATPAGPDPAALGPGCRGSSKRALLNPRLREEDLVTALRRDTRLARAHRSGGGLAAMEGALRRAPGPGPPAPDPAAPGPPPAQLAAEGRPHPGGPHPGPAPLVQAAALATVERMAARAIVAEPPGELGARVVARVARELSGAQPDSIFHAI